MVVVEPYFSLDRLSSSLMLTAEQTWTEPECTDATLWNLFAWVCACTDDTLQYLGHLDSIDPSR